MAINRRNRPSPVAPPPKTAEEKAARAAAAFDEWQAKRVDAAVEAANREFERKHAKEPLMIEPEAMSKEEFDRLHPGPIESERPVMELVPGRRLVRFHGFKFDRDRPQESKPFAVVLEAEGHITYETVSGMERALIEQAEKAQEEIKIGVIIFGWHEFPLPAAPPQPTKPRRTALAAV